MENSVARWLGEHNGKSILISTLTTDITKEQARCCVVQYCILFDIQVDTKKWDDLIMEIFEFYNCWFDDKDEMDNYFAELLV